MNERIYMSSPDVGQAEKDALMRAMDSGWIAPLGPEVDAFEVEIAARAHRKYAVALSTGTAALHLGLLALGVKPGDYVPTSSMTFAATANAITYVGAKPYFIDCELAAGNMDPALLDAALADLAERGERIGAVVPVDLLGKVADYPVIQAVVDKWSDEVGYRIPVLSDAAESLGAARDGRPAGSFGDAAIFSFNRNKVMTTSGGGMFVTDDKELAERVRYLATQARQPVVHYEHTDIGYNYRLSNLLAALGRAQLERLDEMIAGRREMRCLYKDLFADVPGVTVFQAVESDSDEHDDNCWLTSIVVDPEVSGWQPAELAAALAEENIESRPLWKPMHLQPVFTGMDAIKNGNAELLFTNGLTLPSGSALTEGQRARVVETVDHFLEAHSG